MSTALTQSAKRRFAVTYLIQLHEDGAEHERWQAIEAYSCEGAESLMRDYLAAAASLHSWRIVSVYVLIA